MEPQSKPQGTLHAKPQVATHAKEQLSASDVEEPGSSRPNVHTLPHSDKTHSTSAPSFFQLVAGLFRGHHGQTPANGHDAGKQETSLREAVEALIEEHALEDGKLYILPEEQNMMRNILRFGEMSVSDIMIPRTDITAVPHDIALEELKQIIVSEQHSRIPVYKENLDQITGFIHIKDIAVNAFSGKPFSMDAMMRQILFASPSMKVLDLLLKMRVSSVHIAIVVDEYGGTDGLVTMEDIVEEIVGEIQDEHDDEMELASFVWLDDDTIEADARMHVDELEECFGADALLSEDEEEIDTVGGLVFSHLGYIPETGEEFDYPTGLHITILEAEPRLVKRVRIRRNHASQSDSPGILAGK